MQGIPAARGRGGRRGRPRRRFPAEVLSSNEVMRLIGAVASSYWVRLEFSYDYLGRRIAKKFLKGDGDTSWSVEKASQSMIWADNKIEKFAYDGWMPVAAYESSLVDNSFIRFTGSWAWGPDLSGTLGGAGGIGGLAIATDDLWDNEHPSNGVGPMVPVYDGNGNIQRLLRALDREVEAKYEYGPFSETRSIDGPLGQHNPFRWSTKYTDAETGLVYYGYRYYSAGLGRWLSRDPLEEVGGSNLLAAFTNAPPSVTDPFGLLSFSAAVVVSLEIGYNFCNGDVDITGWIWAGFGFQIGPVWVGPSGYWEGELYQTNVGRLFTCGICSSSCCQSSSHYGGAIAGFWEGRLNRLRRWNPKGLFTFGVIVTPGRNLCSANIEGIVLVDLIGKLGPVGRTL